MIIVESDHKCPVAENYRSFCLIGQVAGDDVSRWAKGPSAILRVDYGYSVSVLVGAVAQAAP